MAGISIPQEVVLDGRDLSSLLTGKTKDIPPFKKDVSLNAEVSIDAIFTNIKNGKQHLQEKNTSMHFSIMEAKGRWLLFAQENGN